MFVAWADAEMIAKKKPKQKVVEWWALKNSLEQVNCDSVGKLPVDDHEN